MNRNRATCGLAALATMIAGCPVAQIVEDVTSRQVTIGSGFDDARREGRSIGTERLDTCDGWFPAQANHRLTVGASLGMSVTVTGDQTPRLWILCGQSNFCGEVSDVDTHTLNRFWTTTDCEVYVGVPNEGEQIDYVLTFDAD